MTNLEVLNQFLNTYYNENEKSVKYNKASKSYVLKVELVDDVDNEVYTEIAEVRDKDLKLYLNSKLDSLPYENLVDSDVDNSIGYGLNEALI